MRRPSGDIRRHRPGRLLDGEGLAGQGRLGDEQVLLVQDAAVAGDDVAGAQEHHVPRHDLLDRDLDGLAIAQDGRLDLDEGEQLLHGIGRPPFLPEAEQAADQDDGEDDEGVGGLPQEERQGGCDEQDQDDRALELGQQEGQGVPTPPGRTQPGDGADEPLPRFLGRQAPGRDPEVRQQVLHRHGPEGREVLVRFGPVIHGRSIRWRVLGPRSQVSRRGSARITTHASPLPDDSLEWTPEVSGLKRSHHRERSAATPPPINQAWLGNALPRHVWADLFAWGPITDEVTQVRRRGPQGPSLIILPAHGR